MTAKVWLEVTEGRGEVTVTRIDLTPASAKALTSLETPPLSGPLPLDEAAQLIEKAMTDQGFAPGHTLFSKTMSEGDATSINTSIPHQTCLSLRAVGDPNVSDIDLELLDAEGRLLAADRRAMPLPQVGLCAFAPLPLRVRLICMRGKGEVRLISHLLQSASASSDIVGSIAETLLRNKLSSVGMTESVSPPRLARVKQAQWETQATLDAGKCHGIAVLSESTLIDSVEVRSTDGTALASWKGPSDQAVLTVCPQHTSAVTIVASCAGNLTPRLIWMSTKGDH
jgi:hypothetical protein